MEHRSTRILVGASALLAAVLLTGCSGHTKLAGYNGADPSKPAATAEPTPSTPPGVAHPAAVAAGAGAPVVHRAGELPAGKRATSPSAAFSKPAAYTDGVKVSVSGFTRGTISGHGSGIITGAPYIVFRISLANGGSKTLDLSSVVVTLKYAGNTVAAPVYDEVAVSDFTGTLKAGASRDAAYAFQLPKGTDTATLYVDIDGAHTPATFTGSIPR
ncbi:hypothetical protein [Leifsonia sp. NPDC080035]|uniref:DUF4352 domain-containing protein n=1 Tax=Leifsonia sp. NPDC080035 TaxID=3143936 RepID=A0AAU7GGB9_9MICO